jgi:hypothetical protein
MPEQIFEWGPEELQAQMLAATGAELERCSKPLVLRVEERRREGAFWVLKVSAQSRRGEVLDESLEAGKVWWPEPVKGSADILSILPEENQITLRYCVAPPPDAGGHLLIYPARYLEKVQDAWKDMAWVREVHAWIQGPLRNPATDPNAVPRPVAPKVPLRPSQALSFDLLAREVSFLWGPPGTGKTHTLGYLLAHLLLRKPKAKVLLLSTTNSAVDQALVAVDKALQVMSATEGRCESLRGKCQRLGSRFVASQYEGREHLLPALNKYLIRELAELEAKKPDPEDIQAFARWKERDEGLRAEMKAQVIQLVAKSSLVAMTTTRAAFGLKDLRECPQFDYLVFDESSQVGLAHALLLAPLGRRALFAGDPQQLRPVAQSEDDEVDLLFAHSMFDLLDREVHGTCFLEEQSRMAEPICRVVSDLFYQGRLKVAEDCHANLEWRRFRRMPSTPTFRRHLHLEPVAEEWKWSQAYGGPIRYPSATQIVDRIAELLPHLPAKDMLVLTPFRAQRALLRSLLRRLAEEQGQPEFKKVRVSTVHRAQGMECHTVFFDPVSGDSEWLKSPAMACLINVALSRAQARLVVHLSPGDRKHNPLLGRLASIMKAAQSIEEVQERATAPTGGIRIQKAVLPVKPPPKPEAADQNPEPVSQAPSEEENGVAPQDPVATTGQVGVPAGGLLAALAQHYGPDQTHLLRRALGVSYQEMRAWLADPAAIPPSELPRIQTAFTTVFLPSPTTTNRNLP